MADYNTALIEEFRANDGRVDGDFQGWTLLLLHHTGAKSGDERISPLAYQALDDGKFAIFASKGGAAHNPAWYHNVMAHPDVVVEAGGDTIDVSAREATSAERDVIWTKQKADRPVFATYERKTDRVIPVIVLEPR